MIDQLLEISTDLDASTARLEALLEATSDEMWVTRPSPESWSASECVQHLNRTTAAMLPRIKEQLDGATPVDRSPKFRMNFWGWFIWWATSPPSRTKYKTKESFVPPETRSKATDSEEWDELQSSLIVELKRSESYDLNRLSVVSPFDARATYNLYAAFRIVAAHERRHLGQAEAAVAAVRQHGT